MTLRASCRWGLCCCPVDKAFKIPYRCQPLLAFPPAPQCPLAKGGDFWGRKDFPLENSCCVPSTSIWMLGQLPSQSKDQRLPRLPQEADPLLPLLPRSSKNSASDAFPVVGTRRVVPRHPTHPPKGKIPLPARQWDGGPHTEEDVPSAPTPAPPEGAPFPGRWAWEEHLQAPKTSSAPQLCLPAVASSLPALLKQMNRNKSHVAQGKL